MSPDTNHNELSEKPGGECFSSRMNGVHKEAAVPEELLSDKVSSIRAAEVPSEAKTSLMEQHDGAEDEERIQEYLQRSDTAVIYPEPVGRPESGELSIVLTYLWPDMALSTMCTISWLDFLCLV